MTFRLRFENPTCKFEIGQELFFTLAIDNDFEIGQRVAMKTFHETLMTEIDEFLAASGMNPSQLGIEALNNSNAIHRFRKENSITLRNADRLRAWMFKNSGRPTPQ